MSVSRFAAAAAAAGVSLICAVATAEAGSDAPFAGVEPRVTNGVLAQDRPTTGALLAKNGINYSLICSGTLIGCQTFLTAAHCVCDGSPFSECGTPNPAQHSVYLQHVGIVGISDIDVDPSYDFGDQGDVAVITLSSPVTGVSPTPINTDGRPPYGTSVEIAGFGLTRGGAGDTGMLRRGLAETSMCTAAEDDAHVCWEFTDPLGQPGLDSNTCNGDSGGPLFADLGSGSTVVGITSGGSSGDCLPVDASYDSDVYVHRVFIQGIGGTDLANTSCGSISQAGDIDTTIDTFDFDTLGKPEQACRKEFSKQYSAYTRASLAAWQACLDDVNDGARSGPCPDAEAIADLAQAAEKIDLDKLEARCPDDVAPNIHAAGDCAGVMTAAGLAGCMETAADAAVNDALDREYADSNPTGVIADADALSCQESVAKASRSYLQSRLKALVRCQNLLASGKVSSCPDAKTSTALAAANDKYTTRIVATCSNAAVAALDAANAFGGSCAGVSTAAALAACEVAEHGTIAGVLLALLEDQAPDTEMTFTVPPGTSVLRVTLNGKDLGDNDLDLYLRQGAPASPTSFDRESENGGMFEEVEVLAPAAGTWHIHLERFSGASLIPYQVTATSFAP